MENEYKYFLSTKNICEVCGYDHVKADVKPIIIMDEDGKIMDYTANQYIFKLDYTKAKRAYFLTKEISKRGKVLANLLGVQS